jgi:hypothetical protein
VQDEPGVVNPKHDYLTALWKICSKKKWELFKHDGRVLIRNTFLFGK